MKEEELGRVDSEKAYSRIGELRKLKSLPKKE
jgi:hypothetical protein